MMNVTRRLGVVLASAILLAGCGQSESGSSDSDMAFDAVPPSAPAGASSAPSAPHQGSADATSSLPANSADAPDTVAQQSVVVARLRGADFVIKDQPEKTGVRGDDLVVSHYFSATAEVELKDPVETLEITLSGQNRDGAVPVFGILMETVDTKYASFRWDDRPIDGDQILRDAAKLPAGKYKVTVTYYRDTVGQMRPTLTLKQIAFKGAAQ